MMAPIQPQASPTATHRGTAISMALGFGLLLLAATPVRAQYCHDSRIRGTNIGLIPGAAGEDVPNVCNLLPCHEPQQDGAPRTEVTPPDCDGDERSCGVRITVPLVFPGNHQMDTNGHARIFWFGQGTPPPELSCDPLPPDDQTVNGVLEVPPIALNGARNGTYVLYLQLRDSTGASSEIVSATFTVGVRA